MQPIPGYQPIDNADYEMKFALETWYLDHKVVRRFPDREPPPQGGMPLLTRQGFRDIMAIESASEYIPSHPHHPFQTGQLMSRSPRITGRSEHSGA